MKETWGKPTHRIAHTIELENAPEVTIEKLDYRPVTMRLIFSWSGDGVTEVFWVLEVKRILMSGNLAHQSGKLMMHQFRTVPKWVQSIIDRGMPVR